MWQIDNRTKFAAERAWVRDKDGAEVWLVAVKCTFTISPDGATERASEQPPVLMAPEYVKAAGASIPSLKYELDLVRTKTTTDIIVIGRAHAPGGRPVTHLDVGIGVGSVVKQLRVTGDRVWRDGVPSEPQRFTTMPLVYERAFGGVDPGTATANAPQFDPRNPVGTGFALSATSAEGLRLPNIEYRDQLVRNIGDRPSPAGFGVVAAHWQPRVQLAGTYDEHWQRERLPLLPADFDDRHFQCAPVDQQSPKFLVGGESVVLINLTPGGELRFDLPRLFLGFETFFATGDRLAHEKPRLHTVILEPEVPRVSLVWHTALPCHPRVYKLNRTRIYEKRPIPAMRATA